MIRLVDIGPYLCTPLVTIRELMQRINSSAYLFQIVVDDGGRPLGSVTDGDIRRSILRGCSVDDPATSCMQRSVLLGRLEDSEGNIAKLRSIGGYRAFLPLTDTGDAVREILIATDLHGRPELALIMAGGLGSRLGEVTRTTPKPLLPVGDKPILEHILGAIEEAGTRKVYISVHHLADQIEKFVDGRKNTAAIALLHEGQRLGTIGSLRNLPVTGHSPILIINGDVLTRLDYSALHEFHMSHGYDATITVATHETAIPFGVIKQDEKGQFTGIDEKPVLRHFVAAGIYYLSPAFVSLVREDGPMDMPELLNAGRSIGLKIGLFPIHEYWRDVGRPADLQNAHNEARREK